MSYVAALREKKRTIENRGHSGFFVVLLALVLLLSLLLPQVAPAQSVDIITPRSGATVIARHPQTHLVLRQDAQDPVIRVQIGDSIRWLDPILSMDGADGVYQHYRLPLKPGENQFTLMPIEQDMVIDYQQVQSELNLRPRNKDVHYFHQEKDLPASCRDCHQLKSTEPSPPLGLIRQDACMSCHQQQVGQSRWQHSATVNRQCLTCHEQPGNGHIGMPADRVREVCLGCHTGKQDWFDKKVIHGPLNLGSCTLCHSPHGDEFERQLWADRSSDLCVGCHSDMAQLVAAIRLQQIPFIHGLLNGPGCIACHDPHASDQLFMLKQPINELCLGCHPAIADSAGHPVARHPLTGPTERLRPGRKLSCTSCHEPHGSYNQFLLIETNLGGRLCRECHGQ